MFLHSRIDGLSSHFQSQALIFLHALRVADFMDKWVLGQECSLIDQSLMTKIQALVIGNFQFLTGLLLMLNLVFKLGDVECQSINLG